MERGTIDYEVLPEEIQQIIDEYDAAYEQPFTFYVRPRPSSPAGYDWRAISNRNFELDLIEAQGGMDPEWLLVTSVQDEEDGEDPVLPNYPPIDEED